MSFLSLESIYQKLKDFQIANAWSTAKKIFEENLDFSDVLEELKKKRPFEQILGEVEFYGATITLSNQVLIPRQETEWMVERIAKQIKNRGEGQALLDLCTGSGCIAIALKKRFPLLSVVGVDIEPELVHLALKNSFINQVDLEILLGDFEIPVLGKKFDYIVSNPPYISLKEYENLDESVRLYEPKNSLTDGEDGLSFYRRLALCIPLIAQSHCQIFFEIGKDQKEAINKIFYRPFFQNLVCHSDLSGFDRFFSLEYQS